MDLWRIIERYKVNPVQLLQFYSALVAEVRIVTSYTKFFGCCIPKMVGCFLKPRVEVYCCILNRSATEGVGVESTSVGIDECHN